MARIYAKLSEVKNMTDTVSAIRRYWKIPVMDIKNRIARKEPVFSCDYHNMEEVKKMRDLVEELRRGSVRVQLYDDDTALHDRYLDNLITSTEEIIAHYLEQDREILGE